MFKLFDELKDEIDAFLEQRDNGVLVAAAAGMEIGYVIKTLQEVEDAGSPDVFLIFPHDFAGPGQFATLIVERVAQSYEAARDELELDDRASSLRRELEAIRDEKRAASVRVREALCFARALLPADGGQRIVFALTPLNITDLPGYAELVEQLALTNGGVPWFRGMRIIVREDTALPMLPEALSGEPYVVRKDFDLSMDAIAQSIEEAAEDPEASPEQKSQALMQSASIDYAHGRNDAALAKYNELLAHYQETDNPVMQALVMTGIGDVHNRSGEFDEAQAWYERALVPAAETESPVVMFTLGRNLGHLHFDREEYAEAETYFEGCQQVGPMTNDPSSRILALEWRGLSQLRRAAFESASQSFDEAIEAIGEFDRQEHLKRNLEHLREALQSRDPDGRLREIERELASLPSEESGNGPV